MIPLPSHYLIVYVSGPLTSPDPEEQARNVETAIRAGHLIADLGHVPIVPHLFNFADKVQARPYAEWIRIDLLLLKLADVILRLPGASLGAGIEVDEARRLGIPIVYGTDKLAAELGRLAA